MESDELRKRLQRDARQYLQDQHSVDHEKQQYINVISELICHTEK